ncbi:MAG: Alpha/beta hydrolase fold protein [Noviherbaspirillum sp.]|nr:Alpha/beta hydrolase fold protein [Noviherbaspirillum sp.]
MDAAVHPGDIEFADILWDGRPIRIEYQWVGVKQSAHPVVVFLHEGLGSIALWKEFPAAFCRANGFTGLVFSRYGYGRSTPKPPQERWAADFMHRQATQALPALFERLGVARPWLFGHSDGASIALLYAAHFSDKVSGVVVAAPHIFVEDLTIRSIEAAREAYLNTDLRAKLARFHADIDSAFRGWNDAWLDPAFRSWNIERDLARITCPVLAIQGEDDEYGTLEQIAGIQKKVPHATLLVLPRCGHSPHREQPDATAEEVAKFIIGST